ncbi:MAG: hypothetical protein DRI44_05675 [Chlamydiae bacterium]|nr:MAG: hypothetical protein DRI44_05675 [Chlamydiota bacterium]
MLNYFFSFDNTALVFKGGTCLSKVYTDFYRMSKYNRHKTLICNAKVPKFSLGIRGSWLAQRNGRCLLTERFSTESLNLNNAVDIYQLKIFKNKIFYNFICANF